MNVQVWTKNGRKLFLTPAGLNLLGLAHQILPEMEHSEAIIQQLAEGKRGYLRIGMECHPCYRWLLNVISPFLNAWPDVDIDVKQKFQFNGMSALLKSDIDLLITPDPIYKPDITFIPVFSYELVIASPVVHHFKNKAYINPVDVSKEILITYPVQQNRLDIFSQFLDPANLSPKHHKKIESTDIMLEMVSAGRGVSALPDWLIQQYTKPLELQATKLGKKGIHKELYLGIRSKDISLKYIDGFIELAKNNIVTNTKTR